MRDTARINRISSKLATIMETENITFNEVMVKMVGPVIPFYLDDDRFEELLDAELDLNPPTKVIPWPYVILVINELWWKVPDWRFTQFVCNIFCPVGDILLSEINAEVVEKAKDYMINYLL